ncbi:hypothetical protein COT49_00290 [candidate division WWE3 bacterium CG08_land_8_20_14_0_20_40_13]|uniref:UPF0758 domain-containing protein n=1 Tax=candidate division WWE3 bacterium CG08_land_8_20_14_0_20_40_13 TaxID=1975084 RepID=A0A2H0XEN2_UNCKA|nr:MAG: hypothetical protein COT49_00290 [candidate division WWE3 bacterium CG08_land_8_20_14_0_20_40_13]
MGKEELVKWSHPGGKFRRIGPKSCTDAKLLSIIIGTGTKGTSSESIAKIILENFGNFRGIVGKPLDSFYKIKGLKEVKATKIAAVFEIARRIVEDL